MRDTNQFADVTREEVSRLHKRDDVDSGPQAHHHTLGYSPNQAMSGGVLRDIALPLSASASYSQSDMQIVINALKKLQGD